MGRFYAARIRAARVYADMTQEELAEALGVSDQTIKRRENPDEKDPKQIDILAIAAATRVPVSFLDHGFPPDLPENYKDDITSRLEELAAQIEWVETVLVGLAAALEVELPAQPQSASNRQDAV